MNFHFEFCQWKPDPDLHNGYDTAVEQLKGDDVDSMLSHWEHWLATFPSDLRMVTLAVKRGDQPHYIQLRFWFGEPSSIRAGYVDSNGHNLVVHISGPVNELALYRLLRDKMVGDLEFDKSVESEVEIWRRK